MIKTNRVPVIHSFLFAVYPILALFAFHIDQVQIWEPGRAVIGTVLVTGVCLLLWHFLTKSWYRAGFVCTLWALLFFSYGHAFGVLEGNQVVPLLGRADVLAAIWACVWIIGTWWLIRILKNPLPFTRVLNVVSIVLLIFPVYQIVSFMFTDSILVSSSLPSTETPAFVPQQNPPDIYYIILDGYGRADVLQDIYSQNNRGFIQFLEGLGFYIPQNSHSNYDQTSLSLASSLNYQYVNEFVERIGKDSSSRSPLFNLVRDNQVFAFLKQHGYKMVTLSSYFLFSGNDPDIENVDLNITPVASLNSFELMLLRSSVAALWLDQVMPEMHRDRILAALDLLPKRPKSDTPKFVFAHILAPHPPFVFDRNGKPRDFISFFDGNYYPGTRESYIQGYGEQVDFLNHQLRGVIEGILSNNDPQPIIILQGDHGPGAYLNWDFIDQSCHWERMSIFAAYYFPNQDYSQLYDTITPVNTFRVLFNTYFDAQLHLLDDQSYYSSWLRPFDLVDVSSQLERCTDLLPSP